MKYAIDIDGTLCLNGSHFNYANASPQHDTINQLNEIFLTGFHEIQLFTARKSEDRKVTEDWLKEHGVLYHGLTMNKEPADLYVDDKASKFLPNLGSNIQRKKLAICWSGGLDSFTAYHFAIRHQKIDAKDIILLNFDIEHPYRDKEIDAMNALDIPYQSIHVPLCSMMQDQPTIGNPIIPGRNMVFASIAAGLADTVYIAGTRHSNHPKMFDKNNGFYRTMSLAASQATGKTTTITSPFINHSKSDLVEMCKRWNLIQEMEKTVSCYHPKYDRCGECDNCVKRAIATRRHDVYEKHHIEPFDSGHAKSLYEKYVNAYKAQDFSHYSKARLEESLPILETYYNSNS